MDQSRLGSFIEVCINTAVGLLTAFVLGIVVYPWFGHAFTVPQNAGISAVFTVVSLLRGYIVRRWFNARIRAAAERMASATNDSTTQPTRDGGVKAQIIRE